MKNIVFLWSLSFKHSVQRIKFMRNNILSFLSLLFLIVLLVSVIHSCANMASPTGGLYDVDPPVVLKSTPKFNSLNVKDKNIEILFDENVKIEKPNEKIIITPPQQNFPEISAIGRKVVVKLKDDLIPNTTYTVDFTDAIVDNNEGNPLENFSISFSTGDQLDTLAISGNVLEAENLEPTSGIYVGIHSNLEDTAFTKTRFQRIGRTDSKGRFTVKGMAPGRYKIYALNDMNRDYKYDNPSEAIAFLDSVIVPSTVQAIRNDTIFNKKDTTKIDTIKTIKYTRFLPDDIVLRSFKSDFQRQYLLKHERPEQYKLTMFFAAPTSKPTFRLLNPERKDNLWYVEERNATNDSITLWITDSTVYKTDSIRMLVNYVRTDSLNQNYIDTDTLKFNYRKPKENRRKEDKKGKDAEKQEIQFLGISSNIQSNHEIYQPIRIEFEQPIEKFDSVPIKLQRQVDSVFVPSPYTLQKDSLNSRKYVIRTRWAPGGKYRFEIDSAAYTSYYGLWNKKISQDFTVKKLDEYGNLLIAISGLPQGKDAYVELLDKSDKPFRKVLVKNNEAIILDLNPGKMYARLFIDDNKDGKWTTGNYEKKRQPEMVYYYPKYFEIRAYTDHEEMWNIQDTPLIKQKPLEITKNKPEVKKRRNLNEQQTDRNKQNTTGTNVDITKKNNPFLNR